MAHYETPVSDALHQNSKLIQSLMHDGYKGDVEATDAMFVGEVVWQKSDIFRALEVWRFQPTAEMPTSTSRWAQKIDQQPTLRLRLLGGRAGASVLTTEIGFVEQDGFLEPANFSVHYRKNGIKPDENAIIDDFTVVTGQLGTARELCEGAVAAAETIALTERVIARLGAEWPYAA